MPKQEVVKTGDQKRDRTKRNVEKLAADLAIKIKEYEQMDLKDEIKRMNEELLEYSREIVQKRKKQQIQASDTKNEDLPKAAKEELGQVGQNAIQT
jgi:hypothetical protein